MARLKSALALSLGCCLLAGCKGDPQTPEYWSKAVENAKRPQDKARIIGDLRESAALKPSFAPMLQNLLSANNPPELKAEVAQTLGRLKVSSSVQNLIDALDLGNTDPAGSQMNKEIVLALSAVGDRQAVPTLVRLLKSKDLYLRIAAINALGTLRAKEAVSPLSEMASDDTVEPFIAKKAIQALGDIADPAAIPALIRMMFKERRGVSFYMESSFSLFQIGRPSGEALLPLLNGSSKEFATWAEQNNILKPAIYAKSAQVLGDLQERRAEKSLLSELTFQSDFEDLKLFVRMKAADALGRMRSKAAAKPLIGMLSEEEANARQEYIRALVKIGSKDAIAPLTKAASNGSFDAREPAMAGIALLGEGREVALFEKWAKDEPGLTQKECKDNPDYTGCNAVDALVQKHQETIRAHAKRVEAALACKEDLGCWVGKLNDPVAGVRQRAALEVGRSGHGEQVAELLKRLRDPDLEVRSAMIQAADWLTSDSAAGLEAAKVALPEIQKQLSEEKSKTEFVKVNEDLRRLAVILGRDVKA